MIDNTLTTLYPGGILNTGFALEWAEDRVDDAQPAGPDSGQPWAWERIQDGDQICAENQDAPPRGRRPDREDHAQPLLPPEGRRPARTRRRSSTRSRCRSSSPASGPTSRPAATARPSPARSPARRGSGSRSPTASTSTRSTRRPSTAGSTSCELYVAKREAGAVARRGTAAGAGPLSRRSWASPASTLPDDPIRSSPTSRRPRRRSRRSRRSGSCSTTAPADAPGNPVPGFERSFKRLPAGGHEAARRGTWRATASSRASPRGGADQFIWDPEARPPTDFTGDTGSGDGLWTDTPELRLDAEPGRDGALLREPPLQRRHGGPRRRRGPGLGPLAGAERRPAGDGHRGPPRRQGDLRPGRLAADRARKLDRATSTLLEPAARPTAKRTRRRCRRAAGCKVRIPLYYQGHVYREGSRIRVTSRRPGGDQPIWAFAETRRPAGNAWVAVAHSREQPSRLVLPVVPRARRADAAAGLPGAARPALPRLRAVRATSSSPAG